jgi:hypothetical protein
MLARNSGQALNNQGLMDSFDMLRRALANRVLTTGAALAIGSSSKTKVKIATNSTGTYSVDGVLYTFPAAQEVAFTATTHDIEADADTIQERVYLVCLDAAGAATIIAGEQAAGAGNAKLPEWDDIPATVCPVGYLRLAVAAGSTDFDATTDELDEAHLTDTYVNLTMLAPKFSAAQ